MKYTDYQNEYPLATDYLNRVREADERVQWLRERANNMRMCLTDSSAKMTRTPHSGSPDQQKILTILAEVDEMQEKIAEAEVAAEATRLEVGRTICELGDLMCQKVLMLRFIRLKNWQEISDEIGYCLTHIYRFRDMGLAELEKTLKADEKSLYEGKKEADVI